MSFLGGLVGSLGGERAPPPPPQGQGKPANSNAVRAGSSTPKPISRPGTPSQSSGVKRKAEDNVSNPQSKISRPQPATATVTRQPSAPPLNAPRPSSDKVPVSRLQTDKAGKVPPSKPSPTTGTASPKPPPAKGSFAELMARANAQKAPQKIGVITHTKTAPKEKVSRRVEDRKKGEDMLRKDKSGNGGVRRPDARRSASPLKNGGQDSRVAKPSAPRPTYKGTLGTSSGRDRPRPEKKQSRFDEYLGTDEEDNSDIGDDYGDGYESSDMEGGFDDLEREESTALRQAKLDDARELAEENAHKRAKEERRRKLTNMAAKRR